jgi:hypothetical protein
MLYYTISVIVHAEITMAGRRIQNEAQTATVFLQYKLPIGKLTISGRKILEPLGIQLRGPRLHFRKPTVAKFMPVPANVAIRLGYCSYAKLGTTVN